MSSHTHVCVTRKFVCMRGLTHACLCLCAHVCVCLDGCIIIHHNFRRMCVTCMGSCASFHIRLCAGLCVAASQHKAVNTGNGRLTAKRRPGRTVLHVSEPMHEGQPHQTLRGGVRHQGVQECIQVNLLLPDRPGTRKRSVSAHKGSQCNVYTVYGCDSQESNRQPH